MVEYMLKKQPIPDARNAALLINETEVKADADNGFSTENIAPQSSVIHAERKQIELVESEARYRRLFETAKDGILILDGDTGRITDANPFFEDMLGYSKAELLGMALWEIGPVKDIVASQEAMHHLQKTDYIRYEDLPLQTKAGEHKQVEFVSNVYLVNGWRVIQCNIRDITVRKHSQALLLTANEELLSLVAELQWRDRDMQQLNHMNDLLLSCMTLAEAYQVLSLTLGELFPGQNGCLAISHSKGAQFEVVACWGAEALMELAFSLDDCWALRRGQLHEVLDPKAGLLCHHFAHEPQTGYLCMPLTVLGETLGVLCLVEGAAQKNKHRVSMQQLAMTVGETIKLSLSNLKLRDELRQQTILDPLTNLFNRRYLDETLPRELLMAERRKSPLCIVMLDIDGFKQFNDAFGHGPGDALLREFGGILHEHLRKTISRAAMGVTSFCSCCPIQRSPTPRSGWNRSVHLSKEINKCITATRWPA